MGGGFAISAVVGSGEVMHSAQDTFMSSTMWTEKIGFVAALKTINIDVKKKNKPASQPSSGGSQGGGAGMKMNVLTYLKNLKKVIKLR